MRMKLKISVALNIGLLIAVTILAVQNVEFRIERSVGEHYFQLWRLRFEDLVPLPAVDNAAPRFVNPPEIRFEYRVPLLAKPNLLSPD